MIDDIELLRRFVEEASEASFTELVRRHIDFVYSSALRQSRASQRAEDVTQIVFTDLARKANKLTKRTELVSWLYVSTYYAATSIVRQESRREAREIIAQAMMTVSSDSSDSVDWEAIRPVLDQALLGLNEIDRSALLLRFFKSRTFAEIGTALSLSEDAARKRVDRALEKLKPLLARRGVTSTSMAIVMSLASQTVTAAPPGLASSVASAVVAAHVTSGGLAANLLKIMTSSKSITSAAAVVALLAIGTSVYEANNAATAAEELAKSNAERVNSQRELMSSIQRIKALENNADQSAHSVSINGRVMSGTQKDKRNSTPLSPEIEKVLDHPELRNLYLKKVALKSKTDFGPFFMSAGLTPSQQDVFTKLFASRESATLDLFAALRSQNALSPTGMSDDGATNTQTLISQEAAKIASDFNDGMNDLLGPDLNSQLAQYTATMSDRNTVTQLGSQLAETNTPLTSQQADQLAQIMAQQGLDTSAINSSPIGRYPAILSAVSGSIAGIPLTEADAAVIADSISQPSSGAIITDSAVAKAQQILNPQQLAALQALQLQQAIQIKLSTATPRG